jgi:CheY-like chemotaxis protein
MIYGFARQSGGQIRTYTEVGKGTTMCLYLPRYLGSPAEPQSIEAERIDQGTGETILIVDDEPIVRMLVTEVLTENGYRVLEAADASSAIRIIEGNPGIALLITDVGLPGGMNGRQLADYAENAAVSNGHLEHGMEILTKPFMMSALANKVRRMLEA